MFSSIGTREVYSFKGDILIGSAM